MPTKRVLMLLSNPFRPDPRVHREAVSLVKAGYMVTIICWDRDMKHLAKETIDGVEIIRMGPAAGWGDSRNFIKSLPKFWKNLRKVAGALEFDIIHAHDLDTLSPGLRLASKRKVPIVYDSHELYHEMAGENLSGFLLGTLARYERRMVRKPQVMITVNEPLAEVFRGYGAKDVRVIMNCQPDISFNPADSESFKRKLSPQGKKMALYLGVLEPNRLLLELAGHHADGKGDFTFAIGGFGTLEGKLKEMAAGSKGRVNFIGRVEPAEVPKYNKAADVLLAAYDPRLRNNRMGAPNKLFESMSAGTPIIVSRGTFAAKLVEETGCGLSADHDAGSVLDAVARLIGDTNLHQKCSKAGRRAYDESYNWRIMEKRLLEIYSEMLD